MAHRLSSMLRNQHTLLCNVSQIVRLSSAAPEFIKIDKVGAKENVALVTLNRPKAMNALSKQLMEELGESLHALDHDDNIGAIIITGSPKLFSVGADIKEMLPKTFHSTYEGRFLEEWTHVSKINKPIIAVVNGYAFGGGCELAMMCDIIYAGENAVFGQPEILIGTIPGQGGTQRWTRTAGKSFAMELCLTGDRISAKEAKDVGIVSKVYPDKEVVNEAIKLGEKISAQSPLMIKMVKEAVNNAYEMTLHEGLHFERRLFHSTFATHDRKEGMSAFVEKRTPNWKNE